MAIRVQALTHCQSKSPSIVHRQPRSLTLCATGHSVTHSHQPGLRSFANALSCGHKGSRQRFALCLDCFTAPILPLGRLFGLYIWRLREHVCRGAIHFRVTCRQKPVMVPSKAASCCQLMKSVAGCCAERRQRYPASVGSVTPYPATHWLLGGKARLFLLVSIRHRTIVLLTETARSWYGSRLAEPLTASLPCGHGRVLHSSEA